MKAKSKMSATYKVNGTRGELLGVQEDDSPLSKVFQWHYFSVYINLPPKVLCSAMMNFALLNTSLVN